MRTRSITVFLSATAVAAAVSLNAQTPRPQTPTSDPQRPTTSQPQTDRQQPTTSSQQRANDQSVTITGCLKEEKDVPGRSPNVAERAGVGEDYILTNVKMGQGSSTSAMGLGSMYEVKGIGDEELKKHLNHQVEVMGRISNNNAGSGSTAGRTGTTGTTGGGTTGTTGQRGGGTSGTMGNDLPEIQATSIRMVAATCPAQ